MTPTDPVQVTTTVVKPLSTLALEELKACREISTFHLRGSVVARRKAVSAARDDLARAEILLAAAERALSER